jgi:hypothetical protein
MRKAAYQLLETLYDRDSQDLCDIDRLVGEVATNGLSDPDEEILSLNLVILSKLTDRASMVVLSRVE